MTAMYTAGSMLEVDWEAVDFIHCTLEAPYKNGGLRFRLGTKDAKRNLNFNPHDRKSGPPYWPGAPIMYPEDAPAIAGDHKRNAWVMPASISSMIATRSGQPAPNGALHAGFTAFGFFMAPLTDEDGLVGFTQASERSRVAAFWANFKMPDDRKVVRMNRIGPPDIPDVTIRPLAKTMLPVVASDGKEIAIRVREYWNFNDPTQYDKDESLPVLPAQNEVARLLEGMTEKEREFLLEMVRKGAAHGAK